MENETCLKIEVPGILLVLYLSVYLLPGGKVDTTQNETHIFRYISKTYFITNRKLTNIILTHILYKKDKFLILF